MSQIVHNLKLKLDEELHDYVRDNYPWADSFHILRRSVDARRRHDPHLIYSVELFNKGESIKDSLPNQKKIKYSGAPILIVGAGPAGLFAALNLAEQGIPCHLFDRGGTTQERIKEIAKYWRQGELNPESNVCFGEGGAGLFSDGKLITRIKSPHIPYVLDRLVQFGAPEEIRYFANPHVGSDRIRRLLPVMRKYLEELGCQIHLNCKVTEFEITDRKIKGLYTADGQFFAGDHLLLATGHSAEDIFSLLKKHQVTMEGKSFAVGLRVEHSQALIDRIQYRQFAGHPKLGAANYKLTYHDHDANIGIYSFCMCPGGYVLSCGTEPGRVVSNGMSNYHRNSPYANAAIVATVDHEKLFGQNNPFAGLEFRRSLESSAYEAVQKNGGTKELPAQRLMDFFHEELSSLPKSSCPSGVTPVRLDQLFPENLLPYYRQGIDNFEKSMKGFKSNEALLIGVETRTSCPVRVARDPVSMESLSHAGLFPTGEGAGYAGGITSAACDGVQVTEVLIQNHILN